MADRGTVKRALLAGLLLASLPWACAQQSEKNDPRFLDGDAEPAPKEAAADAPADGVIVCAPGDPVCPGDAGSDAPADGGGCASPNACLTARDMGVVRGDQGADTQLTQGTTSEWLRIRVTEAATLGSSLKATVTLVSPSGTNFDLYVYHDAGADVVDCTTPSASSTQQSGISDTVSITWGEGVAPNASDDSRTLSLEVRRVSGTCAPGAPWTLLVEGNK